MMRSVLVSVLVAISVGPLVFTVIPQAPRHPQQSLRGATKPESKTASFAGLLLVLGGAALGARASVARAVIQKDSQGRYRFSAGAATLVADSGATMVADPVRAEWRSDDSPFTTPWQKEIGATFPLCAAEAAKWDPLGFSTTTEKFSQYRSAEIKHGRVAMMAAAGLMVQNGYKLPYIIDGERLLSLDNAKNGFAALQDPAASVGFGIIFMMAGFFEMAIFSDKGRSPGDFGDPLNFRKEVAHTMDDARMKTCEIEHGRLAMLGVMGSFMAEYVTGYSPVEQWEHASEGFGRLVQLTFFH